jgi:hypothetical protein
MQKTCCVIDEVIMHQIVKSHLIVKIARELFKINLFSSVALEFTSNKMQTHCAASGRRTVTILHAKF